MDHSWAGFLFVIGVDSHRAISGRISTGNGLAGNVGKRAPSLDRKARTGAHVTLGSPLAPIGDGVLIRTVLESLFVGLAAMEMVNHGGLDNG